MRRSAMWDIDKPQTKCPECMKIAEEEHRIRKISKAFLYQILRKNCKHNKEDNHDF